MRFEVRSLLFFEWCDCAVWCMQQKNGLTLQKHGYAESPLKTAQNARI
jgi:hypothetical protein